MHKKGKIKATKGAVRADLFYWDFFIVSSSLKNCHLLKLVEMIFVILDHNMRCFETKISGAGSNFVIIPDNGTKVQFPLEKEDWVARRVLIYIFILKWNASS